MANLVVCTLHNKDQRLKNVLLLGSQGLLGSTLAATAQSSLIHTLIDLRQEDLDMTNGWMHTVQEKLAGCTPYLVVLNMFDPAPSKLDYQMRALRALWKVLPQARFAVLSSAQHHYNANSEVALAYKSLFNECMFTLFPDLGERRLLLIETGYMPDDEAVVKTAKAAWALCSDPCPVRFQQTYIVP